MHGTILYGLIASILVSACGASTKKSAPAPVTPVVRDFFVHGDPALLLHNSTQDTTSFLSDAVFAEIDGRYELISLVRFTSRSPKLDSLPGQENLSEENGVTYSPLVPFSFTRQGGNGRYSPNSRQSELAFDFDFVRGPDDLWGLSAFGGLPARIVHYSANFDRGVFSLLFHAPARRYPGEAAASFADDLIVAFFVRIDNSSPQVPNDVGTKFHYLLGAGVRAAWEGSLDISLCGRPNPVEQASFQAAIRDWVRRGQIGSRSVSVRVSEKNPPFSDVREHCFFVVPRYLVEASDRYTVMGLALPVVNRVDRKIAAGAVMIFSEASRKAFNLAEPDVTTMVTTMKHEMGHFLGLDHEFARDEDGRPLYPSIMSYEREREVSEHDRMAIEQLYGPYPASEPSPPGSAGAELVGSEDLWL